MAQLTQGTLATVHTLFPTPSKTPSFTKDNYFLSWCCPILRAAFPGAVKSCATPLLFFAVLVSIIVGGRR